MNLGKFIKLVSLKCHKREFWLFFIPGYASRMFYRYFLKNNGIYVMQEDWDNLIILDACRYDLFKSCLHQLPPGKLEKRLSRGSNTSIFMTENFSRGSFNDTVFVGANPFIYKFRNNFYKLIYVKKTKKDEYYGTILPETVLLSALKANKENTYKRLIIHFIQPHYPFIGKTKITQEVATLLSGAKKKIANPWYLLADGKVDRNTILHAYRDNLLRVLPSVKILLHELIGKTVITSDHGEAYGEWAKPFPIRIWGHIGPRIKSLIEVPWFIVDKKPRKRIIAGSNVDKESELLPEEIEQINERLRALGYIE